MINRNIINMDIFEEEELYENYIDEYGNESETSESEIVIEYSDSYSDSDSESELMPYYNVYDTDLIFIYIDESDHYALIDNKYYLGLNGYAYVRETSQPILLTTVSAKSFFRYSYQTVLHYLTDFLTSFTYQPKIDIILLNINSSGVYVSIIKTFWLRIVQRRWKKVFKIRKNAKKIIKHPLNFLKSRELKNISLDYPSLRGMLSDLVNIK